MLRQIKTSIPNILNSMANGKAGGEDGFQIEFAKLAHQTFIDTYCTVVTRCMTTCKLPEIFKQINVALLYKPGEDETLIDKRRPIGLAARTRSFMEKILDKVLKTILNDRLPATQFCGKAGAQCADAQLIILATQEYTQINSLNHYILYVDFEDAFTTLDWDRLWSVLKHYGVHPSIIKLIKALHDVEMKYLLWQGPSDKFKQKRGVIQGSGIAPLLFNLFVAVLAKKINCTIRPLDIAQDLWINQTDWADDKAAITLSTDDIEKVTKLLEKWNQHTGMIVKVKG
jgi:hypothetical protein